MPKLKAYTFQPTGSICANYGKSDEQQAYRKLG